MRFAIYHELQKRKVSKDFILLLVNTSSCFCLGLFLSILSQISSLNFSYKLGLFFSIGFLGSLSTFSTLIYDLFELFVGLKFYKALGIFMISLNLGIIFFAIGFLFGGQ